MSNVNRLLEDVKGRFTGKNPEYEGIIVRDNKAGAVSDYLARHLGEHYEVVRMNEVSDNLDSEKPLMVYANANEFRVEPKVWLRQLQYFTDERKSKVLVVDRQKTLPDDGLYSIDTGYIADDFDIDPGRSMNICTMFSKTFDAVAEPGNISYPEGCKIPFYFRTSALVEYPEDYYQLVGMYASVFARKENRDRDWVIASREIAGTEEQDEVRMWDVAKSVAGLLEMNNPDRRFDAVKIDLRNGEYGVKETDIQKLMGRPTAIVDDVISSGGTLTELVDSVNGVGGNVELCVTAMDLGGREALERDLGIDFYSMATLEDYEYSLVFENLRKDLERFVKRKGD